MGRTDFDVTTGRLQIQHITVCIATPLSKNNGLVVLQCYMLKRWSGMLKYTP